MTQITYQITLEGGSLLDLSAGINAKVLPLLNQAVRAVAEGVSSDWKTAVAEAKLWSGEKTPYIESIKWSMVDDFTARVESDYKYAAEIETGRPARDMKTMLDTSSKVRRTTNGKRFLVIPMRHKQKAMPAAVLGATKALGLSRVMSQGLRPSGEVTLLSPKTGMQPAAKQTPFLSNPKTKQAAQVVKNNYHWGGRISLGGLKAAGVSAAEAKKYAGMVRMDTSTPGGGKSSAAMTFRILMDGQTGKWIIPAKPGLFLLRKTVQTMQPKAQAVFEEAIKKTIS